MDVWWGLVEKETAGDYNFYRFEELLGMVEKYEMKVHLSICAPPLVQALTLLLAAVRRSQPWFDFIGSRRLLTLNSSQNSSKRFLSL